MVDFNSLIGGGIGGKRIEDSVVDDSVIRIREEQLGLSIALLGKGEDDEDDSLPTSGTENEEVHRFS